MRREGDRLDFEIRTEALSQAINYCRDFGGEVIVVAEVFYLFLKDKRSSGVAPESVQGSVQGSGQLIFGP